MSQFLRPVGSQAIIDRAVQFRQLVDHLQPLPP
jgi:hypothetical protein